MIDAYKNLTSRDLKALPRREKIEYFLWEMGPHFGDDLKPVRLSDLERTSQFFSRIQKLSFFVGYIFIMVFAYHLFWKYSGLSIANIDMLMVEGASLLILFILLTSFSLYPDFLHSIPISLPLYIELFWMISLFLLFKSILSGDFEIESSISLRTSVGFSALLVFLAQYEWDDWFSKRGIYASRIRESKNHKKWTASFEKLNNQRPDIVDEWISFRTELFELSEAENDRAYERHFDKNPLEEYGKVAKPIPKNVKAKI